MEALILFIISILPIIILGSLIYKRDKNEEPKKLLTKLFIAGFLSCILVLIVTEIVDDFLPVISADISSLNAVGLFINIFIGVALIEEFCKWLMVYVLSYNSKEFDEIYDIIVYSTFVALGFACFENLLYVFSGGVQIGIIRAFLAVPCHVCAGIFMGYYLGLAKTNKLVGKASAKFVMMSILMPTVLHGIYDYCLTVDSDIFILIFFVFVIILDIVAIKKVKNISKNNKRMTGNSKY